MLHLLPGVVVFVFLLLAPNPLQAHALLPGEVRNVSKRCGPPKVISAHFSGPMSVSITVEPEVTRSLSLLPGIYWTLIQGPDGLPIESPLVVIEASGFALELGCPPRAQAPGPPNQGKPVTLANTTDTCGNPQTLLFFANGRLLAEVSPGAKVSTTVPEGRLLLEAVALPDRRRVFIRDILRLQNIETIYFGCTEPGFGQEGIPILFENSTDLCPKPSHLTLWVDGWPRIGLSPGGRRLFRLPKGPHEFVLRVGLSAEKVLEGKRDVSGPFKITFGCKGEAPKGPPDSVEGQRGE